MPPAPQSFTIHYPGLVRELKTQARVCEAFNPDAHDGNAVASCDCEAVWDTGATCSVITQKIVAACNLKPIGMTQVLGVNGSHNSPVYVVNIELPNNSGFPYVKVTLGDFPGGDLLIGMDIISVGDFAVTNQNQRTTFSFRSPSAKTIDFKIDPIHIVGRNDPCHCGSGKKYKKCCGAPQPPA